MIKHTDTIKKKTTYKNIKNTLSNTEKFNKYRASEILNQASDKNKIRSAVRKYAITQKANRVPLKTM